MGCPSPTAAPCWRSQWSVGAIQSLTSTLLCKAKRQQLLTCKVSSCCLLALHDLTPAHLLGRDHFYWPCISRKAVLANSPAWGLLIHTGEDETVQYSGVAWTLDSWQRPTANLHLVFALYDPPSLQGVVLVVFDRGHGNTTWTHQVVTNHQYSTNVGLPLGRCRRRWRNMNRTCVMSDTNWA